MNGMKERRGLTLVEMLVVIAIVGLLVALLLPAVQSARESARQTQCRNNLKQIGLAALQHEASHQHFPTGGWGWGWIGDPDRGFDQKQPGGWVYNLLPWLDQQPLYSLQSGLTATSSPTRAAAGQQVVRTSVAAFVCPSRRAVAPSFHGAFPYFVSTQVSRAGKTDYGANGGDRGFSPDNVGLWPSFCGSNRGCGPSALPTADEMTAFINTAVASATPPTGVVFALSRVPAAGIRDGLSQTYFAAEKSLSPDLYANGGSAGDNEAMYVGANSDTIRVGNASSLPLQDRPGVDFVNAFGSAHAAVFNAVLCDGAVLPVGYGIDPTVHTRLANRRDGQVVDFSGL